MKTILGPGLFIAQFVGPDAPFAQLDTIAAWAAGLGYVGLQLPTGPGSFVDLDIAADSQDYCDEISGTLGARGLAVTELSTHLQGQLVAVHPAYDALFDGFAAPEVRGDPAARTQWATDQLKKAARASRRLGLKAHATFSGALAWPYVYPWPQRPAGLIEEAFTELAHRWRPILDVFEENGVDACFEIHPGEDLHDGATFERFLAAVDHHPRACILYDPSHYVLQQLDYLDFIDRYHERIRAFHVKDAEFRPDGRSGVYGGYQAWVDRPGRFRSLGDGEIDFGAIFSKMAAYDYPGWAVLEWECALKASRGWRARGRAVHPRSHHPRDRARVRRFRRERGGPDRQSPGTGAGRVSAADISRRALLGAGMAVGVAAGSGLIWQRVARGEGLQAPEADRRLLSVLCDLTIPATDTPGALAVGVPAFVVVALAHELDGTVNPGAGSAGTGAQPRTPDRGGFVHLDRLRAALGRAGGR